MPGPLHGTRVVELAGLGPGPHAAMVLADLGADVVRVERPGGGRFQSEGDQLLRGRRTVVLDLKDPEAVGQVLDLVERADVLLEGYRPGVAEKLGLGPDDCLARNPRLVYARITGWGQTGPLAARAGHDLNYLGLTGALAAMGRPGERPPVPLNLVADFGGGSMLVLVGILSALVERSSSGRGQVVDAAMVDGVSTLLQMLWSMRAQGMWSDTAGTNLLDSGAPFYDVYLCSDGRHVAVGALEPQFFAELVDGLGLPSEWTTRQYDVTAWPELRTELERAFARRTRDEWTAAFAGRDACVTPVVELAEAADEPHLKARGVLRRTPEGGIATSPSPRFSRTPADDPAPLSSAPADVAEVLADWRG